MSAIELKQKMHNQIELLFDVSDIEDLAANDLAANDLAANDLAANMEYFFQNRSIHFDSNTIEFVKKLGNSLQQDPKLGIDSRELRQSVK